MKKLLCLAFSLMLLSCAALAEEKEITFQGLAWRSDVDATKKMMVDTGFITGDYIKRYDPYTATVNWNIPVFTLYDENLYVMYENKEYAPVGAGFGYGYIAKKIAGYDVDGIIFYYAHSGDQYELLSVQVRLDIENGTEASADLLTKLTKVYGEGETVYGEGVQVSTWKGANNTAVQLISNSKNSELYYGLLDGEEVLKEYLANYSAPEIDSDDTSGL